MKKLIFIIFLISGCGRPSDNAPALVHLPQVVSVVSTGAELYDANNTLIGAFARFSVYSFAVLSDNALVPVNVFSGAIAPGIGLGSNTASYYNNVVCNYESSDCSGDCLLTAPALISEVFQAGGGILVRASGFESDEGAKVLNSQQAGLDCTPTGGSVKDSYRITSLYQMPSGINFPLAMPLYVTE